MSALNFWFNFGFLVFSYSCLEREASEEPLVGASVVTLLQDGSDLVLGLDLLGLISNGLRGDDLGDIEVLEGITGEPDENRGEKINCKSIFGKKARLRGQYATNGIVTQIIR